jgi:hypothetical protein
MKHRTQQERILDVLRSLQTDDCNIPQEYLRCHKSAAASARATSSWSCSSAKPTAAFPSRGPSFEKKNMTIESSIVKDADSRARIRRTAC